MRTSSAALAAATAAALIAATLLTAPTASAAVDGTPPVVKWVNVKPETVGLYKERTSKITIRVRVTDSDGVDEVVAGLLSARDQNADSGPIPLKRLSGSATDGIWGTTASTDKREVTGLWAGFAVAWDTAGTESADDETAPYDEFRVKRNTMIQGFNVREPATKGTFIRMSGRLVRLDPERGYVGYRNKTMHVLFRAKGSSTWVKVGEVTTSSTGSFANSHRFRARRDGVWAVVFDGTVNYLPEASHRDFVDVR